MNAHATDTPAKAAVTRQSDRELRIERIFNAPRERVWRAFTEPAQLAQWWGRGNPLDVERFELKRGGHWRFLEHAHGEVHGFEGRFREVTPPELLDQTFEWDGAPGHVIVNRTTFEDMGGGRTRLVTVSTFWSKADLDEMARSGMEAGMNQSYAALDRLLARG